MKTLKINYEKDIFPNIDYSDIIFHNRITGKCILTNYEGKVALVATTVSYLYTLPGGGIDENEDIMDGVKREVREETGFDSEIITEIGIIEDYRNRDEKHCISHCFTARVVGEMKEPMLTEKEKRNGLHMKWFTKDEVFHLLENEYQKVLNGEIKYYNIAFNIARDFVFFKIYCKQKATPFLKKE